MRITKLGLICSSLFILAGLFSCRPDPHYSDIPAIEFKNYTRFPGDSADYTISFTDGDGNIRLNVEQTANNVFIYYMVKDVNGDWIHYDDNTIDSLPAQAWGSTTPVIDKSYGRKGIAGDIVISLPNPHFYPFHADFRLDCILRDQAGNVSNRVSSPVLHP